MGYACPVCEDPQSDATHLANHLAFTAMLRGGEHGEWLDEHVPQWGELDEADLGQQVAEHAEAAEFPQVFEDTTDRGPGGHSHDHSQGHGEDSHSHGTGSHGHDSRRTERPDSGDLPAGADALAGDTLDEEAREAIAEAREMTRKRRENAGTAGTTGDGTPGGEDGAEDDGDGDNVDDNAGDDGNGDNVDDNAEDDGDTTGAGMETETGTGTGTGTGTETE